MRPAALLSCGLSETHISQMTLEITFCLLGKSILNTGKGGVESHSWDSHPVMEAVLWHEEPGVQGSVGADPDQVPLQAERSMPSHTGTRRPSRPLRGIYLGMS